MDDLKSLGIICGNLESAKGIDSDLILVSKEHKKEFCKNDMICDARRTSLPRRIIINTACPQSHENKTCSVACGDFKVFSDKLQDPALPAAKGDEIQKNILSVYDTWINFLLRRRNLENLKASFYFELLTNPRQYWNELGKNTDSGMIFEEVIAPEEKKNCIIDDYKKNGIVFWRHKPLTKTVAKAKPLYYQDGTYSDPFFSYLAATPSGYGSNLIADFQWQYMLRQIAEMALCSIVIVDERIAQAVASKSGVKDDNLQQSLAHRLAWMGIWVVGKVIFQDDGSKSNKQSFIIGTEPNASNGLVTLEIKYIKDRKKYVSVVRHDSKCLPDAPQTIEILTVHQTILDDKIASVLCEYYGKRPENHRRDCEERWIHELKPEVLFFYTHSGRGHPKERLPRNANFIEFSSLQGNVLTANPSKYYLVQLAMACKELMKSQ